MDGAIAGTLRDRARQAPDRDFVKCGGDWITLSELDRSTDAIARGFTTIGLERGDRLAVLASNRIEVVELFFACAKTGVVLVPLNCFLKGQFLAHQLEDCGAKVLVADRAAAEANLELAMSSGVTRVVALDDAPLDTPLALTPYSQLCVPGPDVELVTQASDLFAILYTSGTTGMPKGCMIPNGYYFGNADASRAAGWAEPGDRLFTAYPLFHMSGHHCLVSALANDASVCFEPEFSASAFMGRAQEESATVLMGVGPMGIALLLQPPGPDDAGHRFRMAMMTPMPAAAQEAFEARYGTPIIAEGYGQTELSPATISPLHGDRRRGTVGRPVAHCQARIVDDADQEVSRGQVGEIVLRPTRPDVMFQGYWNRPEETLAAFRNLWHHTGDFGTMDDDGFITFVDRKKDALRRRGENVSSFELEIALLAHPAISQVAISAVPAPLGEDDIKASIVFAGAPPPPEDLFAFFRERLPYFAIPRYIDVRETLPVNALGRVQKHLLRAEGVPDGAWDLEEMGLAVAAGDRRG